MAAERAKTMQSTIYKRVSHLTESVCVAKKKPIKAKGIAKTVWLNLISERYFLIN